MKTLKNWKEFFSFLKSPDYNYIPLNLKDKLLLCLNLFILKILFTIATLVFIFYILKAPKPSLIHGETTFLTSLLLAVFAGVFEELVFRLPFMKFNAASLSFSLSGLVFIAVKKIHFHTMLLDQQGLLISVAIALVCFPAFYFITNRYKENLDRFWQKHFIYVFYISTLIFAFSHFFNNTTLDPSNLKLITFQITSALFLGFIRIRAGLPYAIGIHIIWDTMF